MELNKSIDFIMELDTLKGTYRKARIKSDNNRLENSAEHSWHAALAAYVLSDFLENEVDIDKVIQILLIHDLAEMYVGDLFAFDSQQMQNKQKLEEQNAINSMCYKFQLNKTNSLRKLWLEFEEGKTLEAKFALAVDRLMPFLQNINNEGGSWLEFNINKSQILNRNKGLREVSLGLWNYFNEELNRAVLKGWVIDK